MDFTLLANLALFLGAIGLNIGLSGSDSASSADDPHADEPLYNAAHYSHVNEGDGSDETTTASGSNEAWFVYAGNDQLIASAGDDYASLGAGDDAASMGDGNDIVTAGDGADSVSGEAGDDTLFGDAGNDVLSGGAGNDGLAGGSGDDTLAGEAGNDTLYGDAGNDVLSGGDGADVLSGGAGDDTLSSFTDHASGNASLSAIDGADSLFGGAGNDDLIFGHGDSATGGDGADIFEMDLRWADGNELAQINDYVAGTDEIVLHYTPHYDINNVEIPPEVSVAAASDGSYTTILVDGIEVARVVTTGDLSATDITLRRDA
jgi:Ca2+-binding RTX toxin-like protein